MDLKKIIKNLNYTEIIGDTDKEISGITFNSNNAVQDSLFVAIPGFKKDGQDYIKHAIEKGSVAVISSRKIEKIPGITQVIVEDPRIALAHASYIFF